MYVSKFCMTMQAYFKFKAVFHGAYYIEFFFRRKLIYFNIACVGMTYRLYMYVYTCTCTVYSVHNKSYKYTILYINENKNFLIYLLIFRQNYSILAHQLLTKSISNLWQFLPI